VHAGKSPGFGLQTLVGVGLGEFQGMAEGYGVRGMSLPGELAAQLSWPVVVIAAGGLLATLVLGSGRERWLVAVGALPMFGIAFAARFWFSRYLLFTLPPLIVGAALGWKAVSLRASAASAATAAGAHRRLDVAVFAVSVLWMGHQSVLLVWDPPAASWSRVDRIQYIEGGGSGYGYPEAARFLLASPEAPATIYTLDGHSPYQLQSYLPSGWRGRVRPVFYGRNGEWLRTDAERVDRLFERMPTWILAPESSLPYYLESSFGPRSAAFVLRPIATFDKPGARTRLALVGVTPH
jgi:hypothetical protein